MLKHSSRYHKNLEKPTFQLNVVKYCRSTLQRQIFEAVRISAWSRAGIFIEDGEVVASVVKGLSECILPQVNCWWCNIKVEHDTHEACCGEDVCSEDDGQAVGDSTDMGCVKTVGGILRTSCQVERIKRC